MSVPVSTLPAIAEAAAAAAPQLARMTLEDRAALLEALAAALEGAREELVALADKETSLGATRLDGELSRTTGQLQLFATVLRDGGYLEATIDHADLAITPPRPDLRRYLIPLGPVAVFSASNFPFAFSVAGGDTASALAAGCPVVVKGHSGHPELSRRTAAVVEARLDELGLHPGTFGHVQGRENGLQLVTAPPIKAVGFTGSLAAGRSLFDLAVRRSDPIPFYGELSSINPVVIAPQAAADRADTIAEGLVSSVTLGVGQFCTKPGLVFVPDGSAVPEAVERALADPAMSGPRPMLNQRIIDSYREDLNSLVALTGVRLIAGEITMPEHTGALPAIFDVTLSALQENLDALTNECFGPTSVLVRYRDLDQLRNMLGSLPGALVGCLHAQPAEQSALAPVFDALQALAGRVVIDGWPTGVAVAWSMNHGGPWPATTNAMHTSVGGTAIRRFLRPVTYQDVPDPLLPPALRETNPLQIPRRVDGRLLTGGKSPV